MRVQPVDLVQADQGVELLPPLAVTWLADRALDDVALAQAVPAHLGQRDVDVVGARQVAGRPHETVVVEHVEYPGDRDEHVVLGDHRLGLAAAALAAPVGALVAVAEPVTVPAAPALAVAVVITPAGVPAAVVAVALLVPAALLARVALLLATPAIADLVGTALSGGPSLVIPAAIAATPAPVTPLAIAARTCVAAPGRPGGAILALAILTAVLFALVPAGLLSGRVAGAEVPVRHAGEVGSAGGLSAEGSRSASWYAGRHARNGLCGLRHV